MKKLIFTGLICLLGQAQLAFGYCEIKLESVMNGTVPPATNENMSQAVQILISRGCAQVTRSVYSCDREVASVKNDICNTNCKIVDEKQLPQVQCNVLPEF